MLHEEWKLGTGPESSIKEPSLGIRVEPVGSGGGCVLESPKLRYLVLNHRCYEGWSFKIRRRKIGHSWRRNHCVWVLGWIEVTGDPNHIGIGWNCRSPGFLPCLSFRTRYSLSRTKLTNTIGRPEAFSFASEASVTGCSAPARHFVTYLVENFG